MPLISASDLPPGDPPEHYCYIGRIGRSFQLAGGVRFYPVARAEADAIYNLGDVFVPALGQRRVRRVQPKGNEIVLYLSGIGSVEAARALANEAVYADPEALPEPPEGSFYVDELVGFRVEVGARAFGEVAEVIPGVGQDLLVVAHDEREILLPLQADYVRVDEDTRTIIVTDPPEGLLEP
ncbi:MAG: ribosome maturation factor RimM [Trueperaceae bacterium]|nr:ribosome maturation factor RimM [Trueperaceae bacterium]